MAKRLAGGLEFFWGLGVELEHVVVARDNHSRADDLGLWHPPVQSCSPCMVGIELPGKSPNRLGKQLADNGVYVSVRKNNARVAPHVYNSVGDVDRLFDALQKITSE